MKYITDDKGLDSVKFLEFARKVWLGEYDAVKHPRPLKNHKYYGL